MNTWHTYETDQLFSIFSDYHKDVYGFRPRMPLTRPFVIKKLVRMDEMLRNLRSTEEGRQVLRNDGWSV